MLLATRQLIPLFWLAGSVFAQPSGNSSFEGFNSESLAGAMMGPHFHFVPKGGCAGQPDKINMKSGNTYYACVSGKSICSADKYFPRQWIAAWDQKFKDLEANVKKSLAEGRKNAELSRAKMAASFGEQEERMAKARASRPALPGTRTASVGGTVEAAAPAPPSAKLTEGQLTGIEVGTPREEMMNKLGRPYMKISGDTEMLTYQLESGGVVRIQVEDGRVSQIKVIPQ